MLPHAHITLSELQRLVKETLHERFALPVWVSVSPVAARVTFFPDLEIFVPDAGAVPIVTSFDTKVPGVKCVAPCGTTTVRSATTDVAFDVVTTLMSPSVMTKSWAGKL